MPGGEEKGTRTQGTGSQGHQGPTGEGGSIANIDRANPDDVSSIGNYSVPEGSVRGGRQGGGEGAENSGNGAAVGGAFGRDEPTEDNITEGWIMKHAGDQSGGNSGGSGSGDQGR